MCILHLILNLQWRTSTGLEYDMPKHNCAKKSANTETKSCKPYLFLSENAIKGTWKAIIEGCPKMEIKKENMYHQHLNEPCIVHNGSNQTHCQEHSTCVPLI
ncbi:hypothetical protein Lal_00025059 [Lupinus albus]|nr:hypothetical protein Lal_00025059 [Lupinus albus]